MKMALDDLLDDAGRSSSYRPSDDPTTRNTPASRRRCSGGGGKFDSKMQKKKFFFEHTPFPIDKGTRTPNVGGKTQQRFSNE
jgi:hypothetical protein